jgi:hypothetical protein
MLTAEQRTGIKIYNQAYPGKGIVTIAVNL